MRSDEPPGERLPARAIARLLRLLVGASNRWSGHFTTVHERPKRPAAGGGSGGDPGGDLGGDLGGVPDLRPERTAIVMQGPVATADDFTLETLRLYARQMPGCRLILSTWADTDPALLEPVARAGVEIVLPEKPAAAGLFNVNLQLASARAGVARAAAGGAEWILKTRTDQRLYRPEVMGVLVAAARAFPVAPGTAQRHRIVGVGHGTLKYAPYHLTDQTVFGHAADMLAYWGAPLRDAAPPAHWPATLPEIFARVPVGELCRHGAAESYLASSFLARIGRPLEWTLADSWAAYRDHFCVLDYAATDFFWSKVQTATQREFTHRYDRVTNRHELGFADWLLLWSGQLPVAAAARHEAVLGTCFTPFA